MYTSCGWFFDDVGGHRDRARSSSTRARALQLAGELFGAGARGAIPRAPGEGEEQRAGGRRRQAHLRGGRARPRWSRSRRSAPTTACSSLFSEYGETARVYCYGVDREDYRARRRAGGRGSRSDGSACASEITGGVARTSPSACSTSATTTSPAASMPVPGDESLREDRRGDRRAVPQADLTETLRMVDRHFGVRTCTRCGCSSATSSSSILGLILQIGARRADAVYRELYEEHAPADALPLEPRHRAAARLPDGGGARAQHGLRRELEAPEPPPARLAAVREEAQTSASRCTRTGWAWPSQHTAGAARRGACAQPGRPRTARGARGRRGAGPVSCRSRSISGRCRTPTTACFGAFCRRAAAEADGGVRRRPRAGSSASSRSARSSSVEGGPQARAPEAGRRPLIPTGR